MSKRVFNFSPGPAMLPLPALEEAQRDLLALPGVGMSILEISHRSAKFLEIIEAAEANLRKLLQILKASFLFPYLQLLKLNFKFFKEFFDISLLAVGNHYAT